MLGALGKASARAGEREWAASLPLYAASLVVTLSGVIALGMTLNAPNWLGVWALLTCVGHGVSLGLRRLGASLEAIFLPVMGFGMAAALYLALSGSPLAGMDAPLDEAPIDLGTAMIVAMIAVVRTFTLVTDSALLFSPVPAITLLALVASSNPNAEVPVLFTLFLLGSLFLTGYEAHLRRMRAAGRPASPPLFHLLAAWGVVLAAVGIGILFPLLVQPVLGPLSPFALPAFRRLRFASLSQAPQNRAPVGQGPITLSERPVYEVYAPESGRFRTGVLTRYTGREWTTRGEPPPVDVSSRERVFLSRPGELGGDRYEVLGFRFTFPPDPDRKRPATVRRVRQRFVALGFAPPGVPALGWIREVVYPRTSLFYHTNGIVTGTNHGVPGRVFEVVSEIPEFSDAALRTAEPVDAATFPDPETLELPQSTLRVQQLAQEIARGLPHPIDRIRAFIRYIETQCTYTLDGEPTPRGEDAAAYYLFVSKRGACDLAATALTVMCRSVGIPARVAVGYNTGEPLGVGNGWLLRQEHAHMWTEAYFPGFGWVPFDPAPPSVELRESPWAAAWNRIRRSLSRIGGGGPDAVLLLATCVATLAMAGYAGGRSARTWLARRRRERGPATPAGEVARYYRQGLALLARRGWPREAWMTPSEFLESLRGEWRGRSEAWTAVQRLTEGFQRACYGGEAGESLRAEAAAALRELHRHAPVRRRSRDGRLRMPGASSDPAGVERSGWERVASRLGLRREPVEERG